VTAAVVILVMTAVVTAIVAVAGAGLFALIVIPVGLALAVWLALAGRSGTGPREVATRDAPQGEFFGPGGPDDPDRGA
jgi:hypothetical protein